MKPTLKTILLIVAILTMTAGLFVFAQRNDGELIQSADDQGSVSLSLDADSSFTLFVCLPENRIQELPESIRIDGYTEDIALLGPRPLSLPDDFAASHDISPSVQCSVSERYDIDQTSETLTFSVPQNALIIAAVSRGGFPVPELSLYFAFLLSLWTSVALFSRQKSTRRFPFQRTDAPIAFILALLIAFGIAEGCIQLIPPGSTLFPGYAELAVLFSSNFIAFLLAVIAVTCFRVFWNRRRNSPQKDQIIEIPHFAPWISFVTGFGLAVVAAALVSLAPLPGLTTIELASQLRSTCFLSAIFAILAGVSEEYLFRGCIQTSLEARQDSRHPHAENIFAVSTATFLFVLLHVPQSMEHLWALIPIASVSVISGCLKIHYRSIFPSILLHMTYNATLLMPSVLI